MRHKAFLERPEHDDKRDAHAHERCDTFAILDPAAIAVAVLGDLPRLLKALGVLRGPLAQCAARGANLLPIVVRV